MGKKALKISILSLSLFMIANLVVLTEAFARKSQLHLRTGVLSGTYEGTFDGSFQVTSVIDVDYETFLSNSRSFHFRFIQGLDTPDSVPFYTYAGVGMKFYLDSKGTYNDNEEEGIYIFSRPTFRYYVGVDGGIAQVLVKSFGPVVQSVANMSDVGGSLGAIYQITDDFGIEAQTGFSVGYGFSSTAELGTTFRLFVGGTYFF
jgi:hypothetical protein